MSTEYNFYVAARDKNTGVLDLFPGLTYTRKQTCYSKETNKYDVVDKKRTCCIYWQTESVFNDDTLMRFSPLRQTANMSDNFRKVFSNSEGELIPTLSMITYDDFMRLDSNFIKSGYYLIDDVNTYLKCAHNEDFELDNLFFDYLTPVAYNGLRASNIITHKEKDLEGESYVVHGWRDYMYFAYPDYNSTENTINELKNILSSYKWVLADLQADSELILLCISC